MTFQKAVSWFLSFSATLIGALYSQGVIPTGGIISKLLTVYIIVLGSYGIIGVSMSSPRIPWTDEERQDHVSKQEGKK